MNSKSKMNIKTKIKMTVDILMTVGLLFLMGYQFWGEVLHEWAGACMFALFIAHHILNAGWHKSLPKGRYAPFRIFQTIINILLFADMLAMMYSGIVMSRHVFAFLPIEAGMLLARRLHILGSYWGLVLMSLHVGLHWSMMVGMAGKAAGITKASKVRSCHCRLWGFRVYPPRFYDLSAVKV